jgi:FkbM family methyltransferase
MNMLLKGFNQIRRRVFPSKNDLVVRKWIADGGDYALRFNYELNENSIVLDLGGYQGQWASDLYSRYNCYIFIFEPVLTFANQITKRFNKNEKLKTFQYGLGKSTRSEKINISEDGSSVFGESGKKEQIEIIDVKTWIKKNLKNNTPIDLIKINIEGGEYELLDRLIESGLIDNIKNIQVQFHQITKNSRSKMESIQKELRRTHKLTYQYDFVWENWTRKTN